MAASITHRAAGVALYSGAVLLALWLYAVAQGPEVFARLSGFLAAPPGIIILAGYIWALSFHLMNGLRHLYWDSGRGLGIKTATMTAWLVYFGATALTGFILFAGFAARGGA